MTTNIRKEISRLRKIKKQWIQETYTHNAIKEKFSLNDSEIKKIKTTERYDIIRYSKEDISAYLKQKQLH